MLWYISNTTGRTWRRVLHPSNCWSSLSCWLTQHINWIFVKAYSAQVCKTTIHYCTVKYKLYVNNNRDSGRQGKQNNARKGRNQNYTRRNQEAAPAKRIPYLSGDTLSLKVGALGVQASFLSHERGGLHCAVSKAVGSIHYPIDLFTRPYAALSTP